MDSVQKRRPVVVLDVREGFAILLEGTKQSHWKDDGEPVLMEVDGASRIGARMGSTRIVSPTSMVTADVSILWQPRTCLCRPAFTLVPKPTFETCRGGHTTSSRWAKGPNNGGMTGAAHGLFT